MSDAAWETLSNQAIAAAGIVYFLALISHLVEWSALRTVPVSSAAKVAVSAGGHASDAPTVPRRRPAGGPRRGEDLPDRDVRPARPAAHDHRRRCPLRGPVRARHGRRPEPGAVGQHVRVHDHGRVRGRGGLPAPAQALRPGVDGPDRHRARGRPADGGGAVALRPGLPADRGAAVVLAGDPRGVGDHRHRRVHPRRHHLGALPGEVARAVARQGHRPRLHRPAALRSRRSTGSPTGSTRSASRSGRSRC